MKEVVGSVEIDFGYGLDFGFLVDLAYFASFLDDSYRVDAYPNHLLGSDCFCNYTDCSCHNYCTYYCSSILHHHNSCCIDGYDVGDVLENVNVDLSFDSAVVYQLQQVVHLVDR